MGNLKKNLEKRAKSLMIAALVMLAITIVLLGVCIFGSKPSNEEAKSFIFAEDIKVGDFVYLDVDAVSECICYYGEDEDDSSATKYYDAITIYDESSIHNCAILKNSQFTGLKAQFEYWYSDTYPENAPGTIRLYGTVRKPNDDVVEFFKEYYEINDEEYNYYFGEYLFNATSTPSQDKNSLCIFGIMIGIICFVVLLCLSLKAKKDTNACLNRLSEQELALAEEEYSLEGLANGTVITSNYLFNINYGILLKLEDIKWVYKHVFTYSFVIKLYSVMINTTFLKNIKLPTNSSDELLNKIIEAVSAKNPELIAGYSKEAKEAFKNIEK